MRLVHAVLVLLIFASAHAQPASEPTRLKLLFLGDSGHHQPAARFKQLQPVLADRGIDLTYTEKLDDLRPEVLRNYDALIIFANHTKIAPQQEETLLDYVAGGKGLVALHCASYCFLNSPKYIELVGAQFRSHGTGTFRTEVVKPDHPLMTGYQPFSSWDETYVHTRHNEKDRTVLEVRTEGDLKEPWTWVRTHGKGRVFYTAWGHDQRTWGHEGFHNLVERGIRWACGQDPRLAGVYAEKPPMTKPRTDVKPFEYVEAKVPFYPPRGQRGGPLSQMQKPLPVEESIKHFVTPIDFEVKLFVAEDKLGGKPIAMTWDEQGRLWAAITQDYPNDLQPPGRGNDRIVICDDTDGDGVCDTVTTFADKLSIPTSLLPYAGGVIVHQAPVTLFLKDTTGDGKADVRQVLLSGWSTGDTHAGPSNLRYGLDNWIYGAIGYAGFNGTVAGERLSFRQGFYRFKIEPNRGSDAATNPLKVTKLEFLRSTSNNTWGLAFNEWGELFGSTANGCPIVHMPIPNRYYDKIRGLAPTVLQNIAADNHFEPITDKVRQVDWHGGFTAASHIAIYTARTYPREYWNRTAFISEPTGHLTATMTLKPESGDFKAKYGWNLLASDDEWAAPIDAQVGPDGHVWVIDWYNYIVQHNPTPAGFSNGRGNAYETPLRDKTRGRIYRVVYTKATPEQPFTLKDATPEKLVETLKHPNMTWRLHAQRLLVERGKDDVVPALTKLLEDQTVDETGLNAGAVHAVATIGGLKPELFKDSWPLTNLAINHPSPAVRRAMLSSIPEANISVAEPAGKVLGSRADAKHEPHATVRLAALLKLADLDPKTAPRIIGGIISGELVSLQPGQPSLRDATLIAAGHWAPHVLSSLNIVQTEPTRDGLAAVRLVARNFASGQTAASFPSVAAVLDSLNDPRMRADLRDAVIDGLAAGWPARVTGNLGTSERVVLDLIGKLSAESRGKFLKLAGIWGVKGLDAQLAEITKAAMATVADTKATDAQRLAAAQQILEFRPDSEDAAKAIVEAVTPQSSPAFAVGIFEALAASKARGVGIAVVGKLKDLPPAARPAALRLVLARVDSIKAFLDAVEKGTLRFDLLALDQRVGLANHPDKELAERVQKLLAQGGGLPSPDRQKVIEELKPILARSGDAVAGKKMFTEHCAKCHKHGGEGANIGPDLTGFAVHPKEEMLIHIIDPSRSVEGNFKAYRLVTADERTIIGILGSQTANSLEIIDGEAKRHVLTKEDIVSLKETDKSLMPEGFEKVMTPEQLTDLLEFLSQKGRFVPLPLDKVATIVSTKGMFYDEAAVGERLVFPDWKPKTFKDVPFVLVDPEKDTVKNVVMLHSDNGAVSARMPKSVSLPCNTKAKTIHLLGGIGGWAAPFNTDKTVSMIVKLTYEDGKTEEHELLNAVHIADYIRRVNVPGSEFAFAARQQQVRYLTITPKRPEVIIKTIDFIKGPDKTAPIVVAVTVETP
jgi:putative membrane-bound dehydrogenase-like protein